MWEEGEGSCEGCLGRSGTGAGSDGVCRPLLDRPRVHGCVHGCDTSALIGRDAGVLVVIARDAAAVRVSIQATTSPLALHGAAISSILRVLALLQRVALTADCGPAYTEAGAWQPECRTSASGRRRASRTPGIGLTRMLFTQARDTFASSLCEWWSEAAPTRACRDRAIFAVGIWPCGR